MALCPVKFRKIRSTHENYGLIVAPYNGREKFVALSDFAETWYSGSVYVVSPRSRLVIKTERLMGWTASSGNAVLIVTLPSCAYCILYLHT